jgi:hypothetical protein
MYFLSVRSRQVTYERLINEESGLGVSLFCWRRTLTQFSLTPYYRSYFGKKQRLAFVEGFGMINSEKQQVIQNMS